MKMGRRYRLKVQPVTFPAEQDPYSQVLCEDPMRLRPLFWIIDIYQLYSETYLALLSSTLTFLTSLASLGCVWARSPVENPFICSNKPSLPMPRQCLALRHRQCSLGSKELVCNPHSPNCRQFTSIVPLEAPRPSVCNPHFTTRRRPAPTTSLEVPQPVCDSHSFVLCPQPLPSSFHRRVQRLSFSSSSDLLGRPRPSIRPCDYGIDSKYICRACNAGGGTVSADRGAPTAWLSSDYDPVRAEYNVYP